MPVDSPAAWSSRGTTTPIVPVAIAPATSPINPARSCGRRVAVANNRDGRTLPGPCVTGCLPEASSGMIAVITTPIPRNGAPTPSAWAPRPMKPAPNTKPIPAIAMLPLSGVRDPSGSAEIHGSPAVHSSPAAAPITIRSIGSHQ